LVKYLVVTNILFIFAVNNTHHRNDVLKVIKLVRAHHREKGTGVKRGTSC